MQLSNLRTSLFVLTLLSASPLWADNLTTFTFYDIDGTSTRTITDPRFDEFTCSNCNDANPGGGLIFSSPANVLTGTMTGPYGGLGMGVVPFYLGIPTGPGDYVSVVTEFFFDFNAPVNDNGVLENVVEVYRWNDVVWDSPCTAFFNCIPVENGVMQFMSEINWADGSVDLFQYETITTPEPSSALLLVTAIAVIAYWRSGGYRSVSANARLLVALGIGCALGGVAHADNMTTTYTFYDINGSPWWTVTNLRPGELTCAACNGGNPSGGLIFAGPPGEQDDTTSPAQAGFTFGAPTGSIGIDATVDQFLFLFNPLPGEVIVEAYRFEAVEWNEPCALNTPLLPCQPAENGVLYPMIEIDWADGYVDLFQFESYTAPEPSAVCLSATLLAGLVVVYRRKAVAASLRLCCGSRLGCLRCARLRQILS